jgi:osmoprotectant transport system ATP-binding protein
VLIGPSGCGKTTTLKMINRLIEPTSGRIIVENEDVTGGDPVLLRRRIGYVIQQIGLFPHQSVADNVSTVPRLLGWPKARIAARVDEMLDLVGLDPAMFAARRPSSLSGGQRQRVGVARALAADPPVMLMDEPFGAVDPVVRGRLQREFAEILRRLRKTVIMVTHDIDEAIRMGDRIAVMREGVIAQFDTPDRLLLAPQDAGVADFLGAERGLKRLSLITAGEALAGARPSLRGHSHGNPNAPRIGADETLTSVVSVMLSTGVDDVMVVGPNGTELGRLTLAMVRERAAAQADRPGRTVSSEELPP